MLAQILSLYFSSPFVFVCWLLSCVLGSSLYIYKYKGAIYFSQDGKYVKIVEDFITQSTHFGFVLYLQWFMTSRTPIAWKNYFLFFFFFFYNAFIFTLSFRNYFCVIRTLSSLFLLYIERSYWHISVFLFVCIDIYRCTFVCLTELSMSNIILLWRAKPKPFIF